MCCQDELVIDTTYLGGGKARQQDDACRYVNPLVCEEQERRPSGLGRPEVRDFSVQGNNRVVEEKNCDAGR